jgi:hypothetical protein
VRAVLVADLVLTLAGCAYPYGYDYGGYPYYSAYAADPDYGDWGFPFYGGGFYRGRFGGGGRR